MILRNSIVSRYLKYGVDNLSKDKIFKVHRMSWNWVMKLRATWRRMSRP